MNSAVVIKVKKINKDFVKDNKHHLCNVRNPAQPTVQKEEEKEPANLHQNMRDMQINFSMKKSRSHHHSLSQFKSLDSIMSTVVNTEAKPMRKIKATYSVTKASKPSKADFES